MIKGMFIKIVKVTMRLLLLRGSKTSLLDWCDTGVFKNKVPINMGIDMMTNMVMLFRGRSA